MVLEVPGSYCSKCVLSPNCIVFVLACVLILHRVHSFLAGGCRKEYMMKLVDDNSYERYQMHSNAVFDQSAPRWQTLKQ